MKATISRAVRFIDEHGLLLVYPVKNKPELPSLWKCFYPRTPMRWEWTDDGDDRVAEIWHLRAALSKSKKVVYSKWFGGRASLFSFKLFTALLNAAAVNFNTELLSLDGKTILSALEEDSPLATKLLKLHAGLEGKMNEGKFNKAMRELWQRFLIVGYGEAEEGGFPSLAVGSTKLIFEELWEDAAAMQADERDKILARYLPSTSPFYKQFKRLQNQADSSD